MNLQDKIRMIADGNTDIAETLSAEEITQLCRDLLGAKYSLDLMEQEKDQLSAQLKAAQDDYDSILKEAINNELHAMDVCYDSGFMSGWGAGLRNNIPAMEIVKNRRNQRQKTLPVKQSPTVIFNGSHEHAGCVVNEQQSPAVAVRGYNFGHGLLVVETGKYDETPCVFIRPAVEAGVTGDKTPDSECANKNSLEDNEIVLTFPTELQSKSVADALVSSPSPRITEQDAREIAESVVKYVGLGNADYWFRNFGGRELLAKLNKDKSNE